jgi:protein-tyrosine phosphatase
LYSAKEARVDAAVEAALAASPGTHELRKVWGSTMLHLDDLPLSPGAVRALAARGVNGVTHRSRLVEEAMLAEADAVYALSREHRDALVERFPAHAPKVAVLREAAGLSPVDVEDPLGESEGVYEECAARIEEALNILVRRTPHAQDAR